MKSWILAAVTGALVAGAAPSLAQIAPLTTAPFVQGLSRPLEMAQMPHDATTQVVLEQGGRIRLVRNGVLAGDFLDLSSLIGDSSNERGLLGLAFDPDYGDPAGGPNSDCFYVDHTDASGTTNIVRYRHVAGNPLLGDPATREVLLTIAQPFSNHNGGHLDFGPDGMLYIAMGDGGLANDPFENAQNLSVRLGKILRIDVSPPTGFATPADNPFVGVAGDDLIWSYGWRNPWKFSFDTGPCASGAFTAGDVGQDDREEIDYEPAGASGRNYGWDCIEGDLCHTGDVGCVCTAPGFSPPLHVVNQPTAQSMTGGYVYRGRAIPSLRGRYVFGDFVTGKVWSLGLALDQTGEAIVTDVADHSAALGGFGISSFGRDANGELYLIDYFGGRVLKIIASGRASDINLDGVVDGSDLAFLLSSWLDAGCGRADLNNDGLVNGVDLAQLLSDWG